MVNKKPLRERGKLQLSKYFQELAKGALVAVDRNQSVDARFPKRLQGKTGVVEEVRGQVYLVKIKEQNKEKRFLINPIHLKKIES